MFESIVYKSNNLLLTDLHINQGFLIDGKSGRYLPLTLHLHFRRKKIPRLDSVSLVTLVVVTTLKNFIVFANEQVRTKRITFRSSQCRASFSHCLINLSFDPLFSSIDDWRE